MQVSTKTRYALIALVYLAKKKKYCSAKEIAIAEKIPYDFLEKILSKLGNSGIVKTKLGAGGGYFLASKPDKITTYQIVKIFEGTVAPVRCVALEKDKKINCAKSKNCPTRKLWQTVQKNLSDTFKSVTIENIISQSKI